MADEKKKHDCMMDDESCPRCGRIPQSIKVLTREYLEGNKKLPDLQDLNKVLLDGKATHVEQILASALIRSVAPVMQASANAEAQTGLPLDVLLAVAVGALKAGVAKIVPVDDAMRSDLETMPGVSTVSVGSRSLVFGNTPADQDRLFKAANKKPTLH